MCYVEVNIWPLKVLHSETNRSVSSSLLVLYVSLCSVLLFSLYVYVLVENVTGSSAIGMITGNRLEKKKKREKKGKADK